MKKTIEREILIVETIIDQLKRCLAVYHKEKMFHEFKNTLTDIQFCKKELNRLIELKNADVLFDEGEKENHEDVVRSGENVQ